MSQPISYAKTTLPIPLQCVDFDPYNRGYVVVAGGGGQNKNGVPNKIYVLDSSNLATVEVVAEVDLPSTEDNPVSIASLATKDGLIVYAGVNSSSDDRQAGKNEHFRSFEVKLPQRPKQYKPETKLEQGTIGKLGQACLFSTDNVTGANTYAYQASTKLSPVESREKPSKRLGAIVSGLSGYGEIVAFDASVATPTTKAVCSRINLGKDVEVLDLDIAQPYESTFAIAYCTDSKVYTYNIDYDFEKKKVKNETKPAAIYNIPKKTSGRGIPLSPRLRWLSPHQLVLVRNVGSVDVGAEIIVLHLSKEAEPAQIVARQPLPRSCNAAKALDICRLNPDPGSGERQAIIAVAGDTSIYIYTTNLRPSYVDPRKQLSSLSRFSTISNVHAGNLSRMTFGNFFAPRQPVNSPKSVATPSQYVQLASISLNGTVSVETLVLTSTPTSPSRTPQVAANPHPNIRWVLSTRSSEIISSWTARVLIAFVIMITAILLRSYMDAHSGENALADTVNNAAALFGHGPVMHTRQPVAPFSTPSSSIPGMDTAGLSEPVKEAVRAAENLASPPHHKRHHLKDLLYNRARQDTSSGDSDEAEQDHTILVHLDEESDEHAALAATTHEPAKIEDLKAKGAVRYEDMHEVDKEKWRRRLEKAGHWSESQGESVLLSVLFSEYAGIVGGAIRDAVLN